MSPRPWLRSLLPFLLLAGCYNPDLITARFRCTATADCPADQQCLAGRCEPAGVDLSEGGGSDSGPPPEDLRTSDLRAVVDMATPDMTPPPCSGEAVRYSNNVYGCRGSFAAGKAGDLCGAAFRLCTAADAATLDALGGACDSDNGFFVADIAANVKTMDPMRNTVACGASGGPMTDTVLLGCGKGRDGKAAGMSQCANLIYFVVCRSSATSFSCTSGLSDTSYPGNGGGGALCCRR